MLLLHQHCNIINEELRKCGLAAWQNAEARLTIMSLRHPLPLTSPF